MAAMSDTGLCPFSKPIVGRWCRCEYARLSDRCAGKMRCTCGAGRRAECHALVAALKQRSRFVLGVSSDSAQLTHAQLMKIRCGGLQGMQRVLGLEADTPPAVLTVIDAVRERFGHLEAFPFQDILSDIQTFSLRRRRAPR